MHSQPHIEQISQAINQWRCIEYSEKEFKNMSISQNVTKHANVYKPNVTAYIWWLCMKLVCRRWCCWCFFCFLFCFVLFYFCLFVFKYVFSGRGNSWPYSFQPFPPFWFCISFCVCFLMIFWCLFTTSWMYSWSAIQSSGNHSIDRTHILES